MKSLKEYKPKVYIVDISFSLLIDVHDICMAGYWERDGGMTHSKGRRDRDSNLRQARQAGPLPCGPDLHLSVTYNCYQINVTY